MMAIVKSAFIGVLCYVGFWVTVIGLAIEPYKGSGEIYPVFIAAGIYFVVWVIATFKFLFLE